MYFVHAVLCTPCPNMINGTYVFKQSALWVVFFVQKRGESQAEVKFSKPEQAD